MSYPLNRLKTIFGKSPKYIDARANNRVRAKWFFKTAQDVKLSLGTLAIHDVDFEKLSSSISTQSKERFKKNKNPFKVQTHWIAITYGVTP